MGPNKHKLVKKIVFCEVVESKIQHHYPLLDIKKIYLVYLGIYFSFYKILGKLELHEIP